MAVLALVVVFAGCGGTKPDPSNKDHRESYRDGYTWLIDSGAPTTNCDDLKDEWRDFNEHYWEDVDPDAYRYEMVDEAFILGCEDALDEKLPRPEFYDDP